MEGLQYPSFEYGRKIDVKDSSRKRWEMKFAGWAPI